jgi:hypothetical protein
MESLIKDTGNFNYKLRRLKVLLTLKHYEGLLVYEREMKF